MHIGRVFTSVEKGFNVAGSFPLIGLVASLYRIRASQVQMAAGSVFLAYGILGDAFTEGCSDLDKWRFTRERGVSLFAHGLYNMCSGLVEIMTQACFVAQVCSPLCFMCPPLIPVGLLEREVTRSFDPFLKYKETLWGDSAYSSWKSERVALDKKLDPLSI
jgi:hypothetical protein